MISFARGRLRPEVALPVDRATMVSYGVQYKFRVYCVPFTNFMRLSSSQKMAICLFPPQGAC
jgi:hypothetical protein